ncbi:MAG: tetratricopeptide repeat protein [Candidatus Gastranaerophilales bacterium]|nr:tetratricopeptide repeat protein [Candidatus Gastranaerophilales bacterium]
MKRILTVTILLIFFTCGCTNGQKQVSLNEKDELFKQGMAEYNHQNFDKSINIFSDLIELYPDFDDTYYNLGLAYAKNYQLESAVDIWQKALKISPDNEKLYYNIGITYKSLGNYTEAVNFLNKYLQLNPEDVKTFELIKMLKTTSPQVLGDGIIGKVSVGKNNNKFFNKFANEIPAKIEILLPDENSKITLKYFYRGIDNLKILVNSITFVPNEQKIYDFELKKPQNTWPTGNYELTVSLNDKEKFALSFYIK